MLSLKQLVPILFIGFQIVKSFSVPWNFENPTVAAPTFYPRYIVTQKVDHFNTSDNRTWNQRVFHQFNYYTLGGPAFVFLSENVKFYNNLANEGFMVREAQKHGSSIHLIEQRYFGDSQPRSTLSTEDLQYLTIEQSLADYLHIIDDIKRNASETKIILFGIGTGGTMAVWLKQRYPNLVNGVIASSAQLEVVLNFNYYYSDVLNTYAIHASAECQDSILEAFDEIAELIESRDEITLQNALNLRNPIDFTQPNEVSQLYRVLAEHISEPVEVGTINEINLLCQFLTDRSVDTRVEAFGKYMTNQIGGLQPSISYQTLINQYLNDAIAGATFVNDMRQVLYFRCTAWSWFETSDSLPNGYKKVFGLEYFIEICRAVFGDSFTKQNLEFFNNRTNSVFGGKNVNITNVYFTNGATDPRRLHGITQNMGRLGYVDVLDGVGRSFDLLLKGLQHPSSISVQHRISDVLDDWINLS